MSKKQTDSKGVRECFTVGKARLYDREGIHTTKAKVGDESPGKSQCLSSRTETSPAKSCFGRSDKSPAKHLYFCRDRSKSFGPSEKSNVSEWIRKSDFNGAQ